MDGFKDYFIAEFVEEYVSGIITRREALRKLAAVTGSVAAASSILAACAPGPPPTQPVPTPAPTPQPTPRPGVTVPPDDPTIEVADVRFPAEDGAAVMAYLSRPRGAGPFPAVMVCHENRGLVEHIKDVTRRLARAGYVGLAPDLLSREGGTDRLDGAQIPGILSNTPPARFVQDFQAAFNYLQAQPFVRRDRVGMVGFCFGGGVTWRVATKLPGLRAAVVFYGPNPPLEDVPGIQAPVLAIYAERDNFVNPGIPAIENAMRQHNKVFGRVVYPNTEHAFHNDTGPRYNAEAARDAWARTLAWFERYLKA